MTVDIHALTFSPVESELERDSDGFWQSSTRDVTVDSAILEIFEDYISNVVSKSDTNQVTVGRFGEVSRSENYLDTMLDLNLNLEDDAPGYDKFEEYSEKFAARLVERMDGKAKDGIFFVIQATWKNKDVVSMLKLEPESEERSVIDEEMRELRYEELEGALPDPKNFQKGCVYPLIQVDGFNKSGDIKFLEDDGATEYFPEFMGCDIGRGSRKQYKNTLEAVDEMKETLDGDPMSPGEIRSLYETVKENDELTESVVKDIAEDVVGKHYDEDEFEQRLREKGEGYISSDPDYAPSKVEWTTERGIVIQVPVEHLDSDFVQISQPQHLMDNWEAIISADNVSKDYKD